MQQSPIKCTKCVDGDARAAPCCVKNGRTKGGMQRYLCRHCGKTFVACYSYKAYQPTTDQWITGLLTEGCGIRSIARLLAISATTVTKRILAIAKCIPKPPVPLNRPAFEMDELRTYVKQKGNEYWIAYAICPDTKPVIDFTVGKRSKRTLKMVVNTLLLSGVGLIKTDKLNIYQSMSLT
jgi:insertion element IS1 protein InsB